ncbi:hypothetical protein ACFLQZ_03740, partial [Acidobacteriota bacterium]
SLKLFNIFQGIIVAFLATEFFKRDRKHDSIQVVFARSFSNMEYYLGKVLGILAVFFLLNLGVVTITFIIHAFFSSTLFAWQPYILYMVLICLPTLIFMIGLSFLLSSLLQSQAVTFLILLAYSFLVLVFLGTTVFGIFDSYAFYLPLMYSDFIGLGNIHAELLIRLSYMFLGLSFIFVSPLLSKRLKQSALSNVMTGSLSVVCLVLALIFGYSYTNGKYVKREFRQNLRTSSQAIVDSPALTVTDYSIQLEHREKNISVSADMKMKNDSSVSMDSLWLTLNPGLEVLSITREDNPLSFFQDKHLIQITPESTVFPGDSVNLTIAYSGEIDERFCFLDIDDNRIESSYRLWIYDIPKHYALVTSDYVHLTPESGWYPITGLSTGKAFPAAAAIQYSTYSLSVISSEGQTAISQGNPETKSVNGRTQHTFKPETKLPQISLTIGPYEQKQIQVDDIVYSLYFRSGHDYFTPYLTEIGDSLPDLIRNLKDEYEVILGLDYPYKRLSLVEVPIHIYSYQRLWTVAHETVQPQLVFLPEMGTILANADFETQARVMKKYNKKNVTQAELQSYYFNNFIRTNLLNAETEQLGYIKGEGMAVTFQTDIEPQYELFPNFVTYTSSFSSNQWPVFNFAFETYIRERYVLPQKKAGRGGQGLSREEEINLDLKKQSLSEMMEDSTLDASTIHEALQAKGRMLFTLLEAISTDSDFNFWMIDFLKQNRFRSVPQQDLSDFLSSYFDVNLTEIIDPWYSDSSIPGYIIGDVESYDVIDREKTWTQLHFKVANPTPVDGVIRIDLRSRSGIKGLKDTGQNQSDYSKALLVPAETTIDVGISTDQPPALLTIDTYISQNIPSSRTMWFLEQRAEREEDLFDVEISKPYDRLDFFLEDEFIVDNEDEGFQILSEVKQSWLSRNMQKLFGSSGKKSLFTAMNVYNPPVFWELSASQEFFGSIVRSAYLKRAGKGENKVAWNVTLKEQGSYDIFFYFGISPAMQKGMAERQMQTSSRNKENKSNAIFSSKGRFNRSPGKKFFLISHQYGMEEVIVNLENAELGWNLIGTFQLDSGPNKIEQTDKNETTYVLADAVKWVKKWEEN